MRGFLVQGKTGEIVDYRLAERLALPTGPLLRLPSRRYPAPPSRLNLRFSASLAAVCETPPPCADSRTSHCCTTGAGGSSSCRKTKARTIRDSRTAGDIENQRWINSRQSSAPGSQGRGDPLELRLATPQAELALLFLKQNISGEIRPEQGIDLFDESRGTLFPEMIPATTFFQVCRSERTASSAPVLSRPSRPFPSESPLSVNQSTTSRHD